MWAALALVCLSVFVTEVYSECQDLSHVINCDMLDERYCKPPFKEYAKDVCPKRCGLCNEQDNRQKRAHGHGPLWLDHCWDTGSGHIKDPFCSLLTTTKPTPTTTTTTTTEPTTTTTEPTTTTTEPTTTTTMPTTTTTMPTTTTTMPTTTTTMPTTTTTTLPPTTTPRTCRYEFFNDSSIKDTDFGTDVQLVENSNVTLNESVHLLGDVGFCEGVCAQSLLNDGYECWAFTFNPQDRCYLYYYSRPLNFNEAQGLNDTGTTLFLKRCSDDPATAAPPATTEQMTMSPMTTSAPMIAPPTKVDQKTTDAPATQAPVQQTTSKSSGGPQTGGPGGIEIVGTNSFKINGVPSPIKGTCFFLNQTFTKGDHWKDTCKFDCECIDTVANTALCSDICPHYTTIPSNCQLVTLAGQCCASIECSNGTGVNITDVGSGDTDGCMDNNANCDYYPDSACQVPYVPWAKANCALRCDFCPGRGPICQDRISYCELYNLDDACPNYEGWARHNCLKSCNMCRSPGWNTLKGE